MKVLTWDWREQPDLDQLAKALAELGGPYLTKVDTGSDQYAIVLAARPLTAAAAYDAYWSAVTGE